MKSNPDSHRVVVTGLGVVSSIGIGKDEFWKNLLAGKSGITPITAFDTTGYPSKYGGQVHNFNPRDFIPEKNISRYGRASQLAIAAAKMAVSDAGLGSIQHFITQDCCVVMGTTMGETQEIERIDRNWLGEGEDWVPAGSITQYPGNTLSMSVSMELGCRRGSVVIPTACSAGNYAIGYGYDLIKSRKASCCIVGGSDAFSKIAYTGFNRLCAMSRDACRPFDKNRQGMILAEGAGALVIESLENAVGRGSRIYSEMLGYGLGCDAEHMTIPSEEGLERVMRKAIRAAGLEKHNINYISAHGTGTLANDKTESKAINKIFGSALSSGVAVSSIKSMLGHAMGAASAFEAISCVLAIHDSKIPPTINFDYRDEECIDDCVPNIYRDKVVEVALNNSFAFGGNNACLVFGQYKLNDIQ